MENENIILALAVALLLLSAAVLFEKKEIKEVQIPNEQCPQLADAATLDCTNCQFDCTDACPQRACAETKAFLPLPSTDCTNIDDCCLTITNQDGSSLTKCPQDLGVIKP